MHTRFLFIQDLVFRKLLTMSAVKTDVNPSDVGTKSLGRKRFCTMRATLALGNELAETCSLGNWYDESGVTSCLWTMCCADMSSGRESSEVIKFFLI